MESISVHWLGPKFPLAKTPQKKEHPIHLPKLPTALEVTGILG
jgi:hypothetical protein